MTSKLLVSATAFTWSCVMCVGVNAQLYSPTQPKQQQSYSDYYTKNVTQYRRPSTSAAKYTVDRVFYKSPAVSPYLNLLRRSGSGYTSNYQQYVRPEEDRRQRAFQQEIKGAGRSVVGAPRGSTVAPKSYGTIPGRHDGRQSVTHSNYYKHFYGGARK